MTATAPGRASPAAVLYPVNPSIATTSMRSFHALGRASSQALNAALERPGIMSSSLAGPVLSLAGVRSMITVTYLSPRRVWALTPGLGHVESSSCWRKRDDQDYGQEELLR